MTSEATSGRGAGPQDPALGRVLGLPLWRGRARATPLGGGITNRNFLVQDDQRRAVVRLGADIAVHHISRAHELAAAQAAHAAGIAPAVLHHEPGVLVIDFIEGRTLTAADFRDDRLADQALDLIVRTHRILPRHLRGPAPGFWVFHILRDYAETLRAAGSRHLPLLPGLARDAEALEAAAGPAITVFGHNDLLPANFLHDGARMWLIDWEYAGFGPPLFDLGGFAANAALSPAQETRLLTLYFGAAPRPPLWQAFRAMKAAAALREALWSMVSELHSDLDVDFAAYTETTLATYRAARAALKDMP